MVYYPMGLDATFAALADPTRRAILARLASGDRTISDLASRFDMTLPAVSKHIRVLERAGLARVERQGRSRQTSLVAAPMREASDWIERYRQFWEFQFDQLSAYLASADPSQADPATTGDDPWPRPPTRQKSARRSKSDARSRRHESASSTRGRRRKS